MMTELGFRGRSLWEQFIPQPSVYLPLMYPGKVCLTLFLPQTLSELYLTKGWKTRIRQLLLPCHSWWEKRGFCKDDWDISESKKEPWLVWLSGLSARLQAQGLLVRFPVRAHAWLRVKSLVGGMWEEATQCFSPSISSSLPLCLKINK